MATNHMRTGGTFIPIPYKGIGLPVPLSLKLMLITNWHIYPLAIANQQQHIEQSEQLLSSIQPEDRPILYWSVADLTGLVLGFSQKHSILNPAALASLALPIYHRRAGGTAVLVGPHLLTLSNPTTGLARHG